MVIRPGPHPFVVAAALVSLLTLIAAAGRHPAPIPSGPTWVHFVSQELVGNGTKPVLEDRHWVVRADRIAGLGGPFPWWNNDVNSPRMSLYLQGEQYPCAKLPPLGADNLDWAVAIANVVRDNPGGVVELAEYLP